MVRSVDGPWPDLHMGGEWPVGSLQGGHTFKPDCRSLGGLQPPADHLSVPQVPMKTSHSLASRRQPHHVKLNTSNDSTTPQLTCFTDVMLFPNHRGGPPRYQCSVCQTRSMKNYEGHINSPAHMLAVIDFMEQEEADERVQTATNLSANRDQTPSMEEVQGETYDGHFSSPPMQPLSPLTLLRNLEDDPLHLLQSLSDDSEDSMTFDTLRQALDEVENIQETEEGDDDKEIQQALEEELRSGKIQDAIDWFPFKKLEVRFMFWRYS
ncbi:uncharacterized protein MELLADRAFT_84572 [Melampsora larici-populina 98AG31]|uniref:Uncharacterized protein n=1 Tax=Melampsora larici-populina (strain 98AG31 / pathotype 3-4-7) TaxID=747676 RepID=F4RFV0_MELLP|nr:uncharacterized protein MELLADRAFT_84572 [Melampsora larici-populina 98AG31]EGG08730.1 hypothetical protein MELLADRAFT_84572 [Melampsora larici-populina 98AG31]